MRLVSLHKKEGILHSRKKKKDEATKKMCLTAHEVALSHRSWDIEYY